MRGGRAAGEVRRLGSLSEMGIENTFFSLGQGPTSSSGFVHVLGSPSARICHRLVVWGLTMVPLQDRHVRRFWNSNGLCSEQPSAIVQEPACRARGLPGQPRAGRGDIPDLEGDTGGHSCGSPLVVPRRRLGAGNAPGQRVRSRTGAEPVPCAGRWQRRFVRGGCGTGRALGGWEGVFLRR